MAEKIRLSLESTHGLFSLICSKESLTGRHQSSHVGMMSTLSVCPRRISVGRNSLLLWKSPDFFTRNEFRISLWNFFKRVGDFDCIFFSYHISSQVGLSVLKQKHTGRKEGRKEVLRCLLHSAADLS